MSLLAVRKQRKRPELPLVPLIDVLVMLVLFAYVTMQARSNTTLNITLPKAETAGKNEFTGSVTISIDKDGGISFSTGPANNHAIKDEDLKGLLTQVRDANRDIPVLIKADEVTQLKKIVFVMDTCRSLGLNQFALESR